MTLIVGVKCADGIVLGADSSATYATALSQQVTIRQDTKSKLHIALNKVIVAVSGPVGLGQSYSDEIDSYLKTHGNKVVWKSVQQAKTELTAMFWKHAGPVWERAKAMQPVVGNAAANECNHQTAVAFAIGDDSHLLQFTPGCNPEEATADLPFFALGSGQASADVFLAFIRNIFWPSEPPSQSEGELATVWTLDEIIRQIPGFVAGKIEVGVLKKDGSGNWKAGKLSEDEISTHREGIKAIEGGMPNAAKVATGAAAVPTEPIPEPSEN